MKPNGVRNIAIALATAAACTLAPARVDAGAQCGKAAWYDLAGLTASGEVSDSGIMAAAHRTLPFGTRVSVENLGNGRTVTVRINDRGPFVGGRVIDLTRAAAERLGYIRAGIARVRITVVQGDETHLPESCGGSDVVVAAAEVEEVPDPTLRPRAMPETLARRFEDAFNPARPAEPTLSLRFQDAFQPGETLIMDLPALGYAPLTDR